MSKSNTLRWSLLKLIITLAALLTLTLSSPSKAARACVDQACFNSCMDEKSDCYATAQAEGTSPTRCAAMNCYLLCQQECDGGGGGPIQP